MCGSEPPPPASPRKEAGTLSAVSAATPSTLSISGQESGLGISPLRGQNNVQGALSDVLHRYGKVTDHAALVSARSGCGGRRVPDRPGLRIPEMFAAARAGRVLPAASWLEKDGTFVDNSGSMTRRTANLRVDPCDLLDVHPADAARYDLRDGHPVIVESRHGRARLATRVSDEVARGQVFYAFHFPSSGVNSLVSGQGDTVTSCPEYKVTAVRLAPAVFTAEMPP
jgi:predicted molibdopterin-dependent oxidoreductase YjgC